MAMTFQHRHCIQGVVWSHNRICLACFRNLLYSNRLPCFCIAFNHTLHENTLVLCCIHLSDYHSGHGVSAIADQKFRPRLDQWYFCFTWLTLCEGNTRALGLTEARQLWHVSACEQSQRDDDRNRQADKVIQSWVTVLSSNQVQTVIISSNL